MDEQAMCPVCEAELNWLGETDDEVMNDEWGNFLVKCKGECPNCGRVYTYTEHYCLSMVDGYEEVK